MSAAPADPVRHAGPQAALVLEELAERRARSLTVTEDKQWLRAITPHYARLLSRMEDARLLYRIQRGRYVVAPRGSFSLAQAAPTDLLVDRILAPHGDYFISHLSALISHRLTDLHSGGIYASVRKSSTFRRVEVELPSGTLRVARIADARWPASASETSKPELEEVRAMPDTMEFVWHASLERALVDAVARPELCAGFETVVACWMRARDMSADWDAVCEIARRQGPSMIRRTAYLLRLMGLGAVAQRAFPNLTGRGVSTPLDRSASFPLAAEDCVRDRATGIVVNVPHEYLLAWTGATSLS